MSRMERGFTLIELMIVVVILGILAAISIPAYLTMQNRAKEGMTKANMHTFQLAAEHFGVDNNGSYASTATQVAGYLPNSGFRFENPFTHAVGDGSAYEDRASWAVPLATSGVRGIVAYGDSANYSYQVAGHGMAADFELLLTSGR